MLALGRALIGDQELQCPDFDDHDIPTIIEKQLDQHYSYGHRRARTSAVSGRMNSSDSSFFINI